MATYITATTMSEIISTRDHHDIYDFVNPLKNPALRVATEGKSVIITGAGEGIGRVRTYLLLLLLWYCGVRGELDTDLVFFFLPSLCQGMAEQFAHAGASTFFLTVRSNKEALAATAARVEAINPRAKVHTQLLNHTSPSGVDGLFSTVRTELGGTSADILMNNAGYSTHFSEVAGGDVGTWWESLEGLLKGPYLVSRAFIRSALEEKKRGVIVHTTSIASYYSVKECSAYQVAKIGLNRLSEFIRIGMYCSIYILALRRLFCLGF